MMKKIFASITNFVINHKITLLAVGGAAIAAWLLPDADSSAICAAIIPGIAGGKHVAGEPLTLASTNEASPGLLRNDIDDRIVKIRPMATPIDQISRMAGSRQVSSMDVEYYAVDTPATELTLTTDYSPSAWTQATDQVATLRVDNPNAVAPTDTLLVPSVTVDGDGQQLVLYVVETDASGTIKVMAVNGPSAEGKGRSVPAIDEDTTLIRMGRAAGELDVMTSQYQSVPVAQHNFCQIFKSQVEETTLQKIANKSVGWNFSDQEETAIIDMRLSMEKTFLFGHCAKLRDPSKGTDIFFTGGIWNQAGQTYDYTIDKLNSDTLIDMSRRAFTGMGCSSKKIIVGGSRLIEQLSRLEHTKVIGASETTTKWGLDFTEIVTKFGRLYVIISETFDQCGHAYDGMIIDPEYITKYCHQPFHTKLLDLRSAGVRNTDAVVITESSCLVLRYPNAHMRIVGKKA